MNKSGLIRRFESVVIEIWMNLIPMRRNSILLKVQHKEENFTFSRFLSYAVSTVLVILLSSRLNEPQYHPYIFKIVISVTLLSLIGGLAGVLFVRFLAGYLSQRYFVFSRLSGILGYTTGAALAAYHWEKILLYHAGIKMGCPDPILGKDIAFYLFDLPLYKGFFVVMFCLVAVSLTCLFVKLFMQNDEDYRRQMHFSGRIFQNRYDWIYIHIGLLFCVLSWGRYLERYDTLFWRMGPDFAGGPVLLPSFSLIFVAMITGIFFLIFPVIRSRPAILPVLKKLSARRHSLQNPHLCLIQYVLTLTLFMFWHTAPQTSQPPVLHASPVRLSVPFSDASKPDLQKLTRHYTQIKDPPFSTSQLPRGENSNCKE